MSETQAVIKRVRGLAEHEQRINLHHYPIRIDVVEGVVILEELEDASEPAVAGLCHVLGGDSGSERLRVQDTTDHWKQARCVLEDVELPSGFEPPHRQVNCDPNSILGKI